MGDRVIVTEEITNMEEMREYIRSQMNSVTDTHLDKFLDIWKDIGLRKEGILERVEKIRTIADSLWLKAISDAEIKKKKLLESVEKHGAELFEISKELGIKAKQPNASLPMIELEKLLVVELAKVKAQKAERLTRFKDLIEKEKSLTLELASTPLNITYSSVPSLSQLDELEKRNEELVKERDRRLCTFNALKSIITRMVDELEIVAPLPAEFDVISENECFLLSEANLASVRTLRDKLEKRLKSNAARTEKLRRQLHELWTLLQVPDKDIQNFLMDSNGRCPSTILKLEEEIQKLEKMKMEHLEVFVSNIREQLLIYWDRCFYSQSQKDAFEAYYDGEFTEELLESHEEELQKLKDIYAESQELFQKFSRRAELWSKMLELQQTAKDTDRFNNRGGKLLQEEKERKKLMAQIPKLEQELNVLAEKWETDHGRPCLVYGLPIPEYIAKQWESYEQEKENERLARQYAKAKLLETEMVKGAKSANGTKRLLGTPASSRASKMAKIGTPLSCSSLIASQKRGQHADKYSVLCNTPLRKPPKSSSKVGTPLPLNSLTTSQKQCPRIAVNGIVGNTPLGKPPKFVSKVSSQKPKCLPRRILQRGVVASKSTTNYMKTKHSIVHENNDCKTGMNDASTLSTYSEFQNELHPRAKDAVCSTFVKDVASSSTTDLSKTMCMFNGERHE